MHIQQHLQQLFAKALQNLVEDPSPYAAMVRPAQDPKFGDYQANCAMSLAKKLKQKPRDIAQKIVDNLDLGDMLEPPEIAGPGFINLRLKTDWLAQQIQSMGADERLGVETPTQPKTYVIDYSSPNVAKPMHVGHLRSSIIGDALARTLRFLGHRVISDNHLGDWGKQFGILLYGYKNFRDDAAFEADPVAELLRIYKHVNGMISEGNQEIDEACRHETAKLHNGDEENVELWKRYMPSCYEEIDQIYQRLDIHFDYTLGESFYHDKLADVVADLQAKGIIEESDGALVVPPRNEDPSPLIVRKSDGAYTYATTDLATIKYRVDEWSPDALLYVVDFRQAQHFDQLFYTARRWGYTNLQMEHIQFGAMLAKSGKPIKTREGDSTQLKDLLEEAKQHAKEVHTKLQQERPEEREHIPGAELEQIYEVIGQGAVKYADLCQNRTTDYKFDVEKMMATDGNTATYMQYAYARNRSIFRKGDEDAETYRKNPPLPSLAQPEERNLAAQLIRFQDAITSAGEDLKPNLITAYLWDVAKAYSTFFNNCPVLKAETPQLRKERLLLCDLTARVIQQALQLLGIKTVERM